MCGIHCWNFISSVRAAYDLSTAQCLETTLLSRSRRGVKWPAEEHRLGLRAKKNLIFNFDLWKEARLLTKVLPQRKLFRS